VTGAGEAASVPVPGAPDAEAEALTLVRMAFAAARVGDAETLRALLDRGVPANVRNEKGDSLLMLAAYHGHQVAVGLLLERGADPELTNDRGQTPLAGVAFKGDAAAATLLLDHGAAVDNAGPDGRTALMFAAMFDRVEIVELLVARGADPARRDAGGASAADLARGMGAARAAARLA
jgi:hypothetical protein